MTTTKSYVTIKGTKDGLVFNMDDTCSYQDIILELKDKLKSGHHLFLKGPLIRVTVRLGYRFLKTEQEIELKDFIRSMGNLVVDQLESHVVSKAEVERARLQANIQVIQRTIRSGQVYQCDGNALILGDVNPGGCIQAPGNIYVMGSLRGMAHAGINGDLKAIIAASILQPTQLRIANIVSRQPDEWEEEQYQMEFAYIEGTQIVIDKLHHLTEIRPGLQSLI